MTLKLSDYIVIDSLHVQSSSSCYFFSVVNCGDIAEPQNGHVKIDNTRYQGTARYGCNAGYELSAGADAVRNCQSNGQWSGTPPHCIGRFF